MLQNFFEADTQKLYPTQLDNYFLLFQCIEGMANFPYQILLVSFHLQYRNDSFTCILNLMRQLFKDRDFMDINLQHQFHSAVTLS